MPNCDLCGAPIAEQKVTYTLEIAGKFVVVENVPARVCAQCGERFYAPATVEQLQKTLWEQKEPKRVLTTPVFEFAG